MKDMRQIKLIADSLNKMRETHLVNLARVNKLLLSKIATRQKMIAYQNEYLDTSKFNMSKSMPSLNKNLHLFTKKIESAIEKVEDEIGQIELRKKSILKDIELVEQKIELMSVFKNKEKAHQNKLLEKSEQLTHDLFVTNKQYRGEHD